MSAPALQCEGVSLHFGGVSALSEVSFDLSAQEIVVKQVGYVIVSTLPPFS